MTTAFGLPAELAGLADEYEFLNELGRGGAAVVYRAVDRVLGREVAVKVVHPKPTAPADDPVARLAREARTVAQLQHPNIVSVYAVRRLPGGGLALVMPLVPGRTLKQTLLEDGPLSPEQAERVLIDVAGALAYAHVRGVVHRDVKPENIFLDAETGRALLADFGIARSDNVDSLTMTGMAIGTPFYMSPEQIEGRTVDGRSDLYSLGLVAWEMLTGRRPWDGESLYSIIYKQRHEGLPPIEALRSGVPLRLQYIIERSLQKRPPARWAGADGLLTQLHRSVVPADYANWQATLPDRIQRFRIAEEERAGSQPSPATATTTATPDATIRFAPADLPLAGSGPSPDVVGSAIVGKQDAPGEVRHAQEKSGDREVPAEDVPDWGLPAADVLPAADPRPRRWGRVALGAVGSMALLAVLAARMTGASSGFGLNFGSPLRVLRASNPMSTREHGGRVVALGTGAEVTASPVHGTAPSSRVGALPAAFAAAISTGAAHSCAIAPSARIHCWGRNTAHQLGDPTVRGESSSPRTVVGVMSYTSVAAGGAHSCGITRLGDLYCWGDNSSGQLGDGTTVRRSAPVRAAGPAAYSFVQLGATYGCGVTDDAAVRCWGDNRLGQLGDGTQSTRTVPGPVHLPPGAEVRSLGVGSQHTCAVIADGRVFCWGENSAGQLGREAGISDMEPAEVPRIRALTVVAGGAHTCVLSIERVVRCWGRNDDGQLGAPTRSAGNAAVPLGGGTTDSVRQLAAGAGHTCALMMSGTAWCWGRNSSGQLGDSSYTRSTSPVRVLGGPFTQLSAGGESTCALTALGGRYCWGADDHGQVGDGAWSPQPAPVAVTDPAMGVVASRSTLTARPSRGVPRRFRGARRRGIAAAKVDGE